MVNFSFLGNIMDKYKIKYENGVTPRQIEVNGVVPFHFVTK